jgi:hypothetical protein
VQWFTRGFRDGRKDPSWFPALADRTGRWAGALTVAGQWRSFTAFPSILAIAVVGWAALCRDSRYDMEEISKPTTFIDRKGRKVKMCGAKKFTGSQKSIFGLQCRKEW